MTWPMDAITAAGNVLFDCFYYGARAGKTFEMVKDMNNSGKTLINPKTKQEVKVVDGKYIVYEDEDNP